MSRVIGICFFTSAVIALSGCFSEVTVANPDASRSDGRVVDSARSDAGSAEASVSDARTTLDAGPSDGGPPSAIDRIRDDFCRVRAEGSCSAARTCQCAPKDFDPSACIEASMAKCEREILEVVEPLLASGAIRLDGDQLAECKTRLETGFSSCSVTQSTLNYSCTAFLVSDVGIDEECPLTNARCHLGLGTCRSGTCEFLASVEELCSSSFPCPSSLTCRRGLCVLPSELNAHCDKTDDCEAGLFCSSERCIAALAPLGASCATHSDCVMGAVCTEGSCTTGPVTCDASTTCGNLTGCLARFSDRECGDRLPTGGACLQTSECQPGHYCGGDTLTCDVSVRAGAPCPSGYECDADSFCDQEADPRVCVANGARGEHCYIDMTGRPGCRAGLACVAGICTDPPSGGSACSDDYRCAAPNVCYYDADDGSTRCGAPAVLGEPCSALDPRACSDGSACLPEGDAGDWRCRAPRAVGDVCHFEVAGCPSGTICRLGSRDTRVGTCLPPVERGGDCFVSEDCAGDSGCIDLGQVLECAPIVCPTLNLLNLD